VFEKNGVPEPACLQTAIRPLPAAHDALRTVSGRTEAIALMRKAALHAIEATLVKQMSWAVWCGKLV
jgi:hypothetical protein